MPRLIWTPEALADVQRLYRFLASKDANAAGRAVQAIRAGVKILAQRPRIGRPVEDMEPEFREWPIGFGNYQHRQFTNYALPKHENLPTAF